MRTKQPPWAMLLAAKAKSEKILTVDLVQQ
jgi:hypothetical protein